MAQRAGKDERRWHDAQPPAAPLMTMLPLTSPMLLMGHPFYTSFVNGDWRQNKEKKEKKKKKKKKRKKRRRRRRRKKKTKKVGEEGEEKKEEGGYCFVLLFALRLSNMPVYPRVGSAQSIVRAVTLRQKSQIQLAISPSHSLLTH